MPALTTLRQLTALGLRCCSLFFFWRAILFLFDYNRACTIYQSLQPGHSVSDESGTTYLQGKYGDGVSIQLCHTVFGYFLEYLLAGVLLWALSIPLARLLTRNLEKA